VRDAATEALRAAVKSSSSSSSSSSTSTVRCNGAVLEDAFAALTGTVLRGAAPGASGAVDAYADLLLGLWREALASTSGREDVDGGADGGADGGGGGGGSGGDSGGAAGGGGGRAIFEAEETNMHAEAVLSAQLVAKHLALLLAHSTSPATEAAAEASAEAGAETAAPGGLAHAANVLAAASARCLASLAREAEATGAATGAVGVLGRAALGPALFRRRFVALAGLPLLAEHASAAHWPEGAAWAAQAAALAGRIRTCDGGRAVHPILRGALDCHIDAAVPHAGGDGTASYFFLTPALATAL